jgi:hypothetical protein
VIVRINIAASFIAFDGAALVDGEVFDVKRVGIRIGRVAQSNEVGGL